MAIASITAPLLLIPSIAFMLVVERFRKADVLAMVGPREDDRMPAGVPRQSAWNIGSVECGPSPE